MAAWLGPGAGQPGLVAVLEQEHRGGRLGGLGVEGGHRSGGGEVVGGIDAVAGRAEELGPVRGVGEHRAGEEEGDGEFHLGNNSGKYILRHDGLKRGG